MGGFNHTPNADGIIWFVQNMMPALRHRLPDLRLHIVGSNPTQAILDLASKDITVHGRVTDEYLDRLYETAAAAVIPLRYGGGVKGKVIEPMAKGVPVIMTDIGAQGIDDARSCAYVGNSPDEMVELVIQCLRERQHAKAKALNALNFIRRKYSLHAVSEMLSENIPEIRNSRMGA